MPDIPSGTLISQALYHAFYYTPRGFSVNAENCQTCRAFAAGFVTLCMFMQFYPFIFKFYAVKMYI